MSTRPVPYDVPAEWDALAIATTSTPGRSDLLAELVPDDFSGDRTRLWQIVADLHADGRAVTDSAVAVAAQLDVAAFRRTLLQASPIHPADTIRRVVEAAARRRVIATAETAIEAAADPLVPVADTIDATTAALVDASPVEYRPVPGYDDWADGVSMEHDWLIPDLLERRERVIVVAGEGAGKSYLVRQIAMQAASGIHFRRETRIAPIRSLIVDAENSDRQVVRNAARMRALCEKHGDWDQHRFGVVTTSHVDLHKRRDRGEVEGYLRSFRPDLLVIGPLYKVFSRGNRDFDVAATHATQILDDWRERFGVAMLIEHHAPKAAGGRARELDPFGSSVWMRWPEVGLTLAPKKGDGVADLFTIGRFRPDREARSWPDALIRGDRTTWPWRTTPDDPQRRMFADEETF